MLSRKFTWWCFGGFFKIFFREESLSVFESGGLEGGVHYKSRKRKFGEARAMYPFFNPDPSLEKNSLTKPPLAKAQKS